MVDIAVIERSIKMDTFEKLYYAAAGIAFTYSGIVLAWAGATLMVGAAKGEDPVERLIG